MTSLLRKLHRHRLASLGFVIAWAATLALTVVTWEVNADGYSMGMNTAVIPIHLALTVGLGALVGWRMPGKSPARAGALAGLVFGIMHAIALAVVDTVWNPPLESGLTLVDLWGETLVFIALFTVISVILSVAAAVATARFRGSGTAPARS